MNISGSASDKGNKLLQILEVAQIRFGRYGLEKTSMQEIADDLKISKASLYYYFPDKESMYRAVVEKEQNEFLTKISETTENIMDPGQLLRGYSRARLSYFRTLLNLSRLRNEAYYNLKPVFREAINIFKEKETEIIKEIFRKGIIMGKFHIEDTNETASLYLDLLRGLRVSVVSDKKTLFIEQEEYDRLLEKTEAFTDIFIKALTVK